MSLEGTSAPRQMRMSAVVLGVAPWWSWSAAKDVGVAIMAAPRSRVGPFCLRLDRPAGRGGLTDRYPRQRSAAGLEHGESGGAVAGGAGAAAVPYRPTAPRRGRRRRRRRVVAGLPG